MRRHREAREREATGGGEEAQRGDPVPQDHQPAAQGNGSRVQLDRPGHWECAPLPVFQRCIFSVLQAQLEGIITPKK